MNLQESRMDNFSLSLNHNQLFELYGDDKEYATDMIQTFLDEVLPDFTIMNDAINQQDWASLAQYIHKLKPTLPMMGLSDLEPQMQEIERKSKIEGNWDVLKQLSNSFQKKLALFIPLLEAELKQLTQQ